MPPVLARSLALAARSWPRILVISSLLATIGSLAAQDRSSSLPDAGEAPGAPVIVPHNQVETTWLDEVDAVFKQAVGYMERVLFFRLFSTERQFIQFDEREYYYRAAGSLGPLEALVASNREPRLTMDEVQALRALDQVELSPRGEPLWLGQLGEEEVEFAVVVRNQDKYVLRDGKFRRRLPRLEQLAGDARPAARRVLADEEVEAAIARGALALAPGKSAADDRPYLQTEYVGGIPLVVLWLAAGAVFFTIYMRGYNLWGFVHALKVVRGHYDDPSEPGEVSHFQALSSALSATVGLGNIAGVTIAMTTGGPGAFFWMMCCGVFGMTSKFTECTLGVKYRRVNPDGTVLGGPMQYLYLGLKERGLGVLGMVLSLAFTVMCILASFGGGNMFQANQAGQQVLTMLQMSDQQRVAQLSQEIRAAAAGDNPQQLADLLAERTQIEQRLKRTETRFLPLFGVLLAVMVGVVIIGGIKRIGAAAARVVPTMCLVYLLACLFIIFKHLGQVPELVMQIFTEAFEPRAFGGGVLGVLVIGVQRAAFSNEAGVGSAAIAHSAARTDEPIREGTVALLEPFIDTVVVCSMTALVILITGAWENETWIVEQKLVGSSLTTKAFQQEIPGFAYVLSLAVVLFAYSTLISWSYYGERCWVRLFGERSAVVYKGLFIVAAFVGVIVNLGAVLDFSDMMILSMAFPNVLGLLILAPSVRRDLLDYWRRLKAGEFEQEIASRRSG